MRHLVLQGCTHHVQRAKDVIANAFAHIGLYHGHMLVSGCVVDGCRAISAANLCDAVGVGYARQQRYKGALGDALLNKCLQFLMDVVKRELTVVHQQQSVGVFCRNLATQLAAYAATCSSDHDHLACQVAAQQFGVGHYGFAAQQVFNVQVLKLGDGDPATGQVG